MASFEDNVKRSFSKVKDHMESIEGDTKRNKRAILEQIELIKALKMEINDLKTLNNDLKDKIETLTNTSTGNKGVINDHQRSSTIISDAKQSSTVINDDQQPSEIEIQTPTQTIPTPGKETSTLTFADLKKELEGQFKQLTDREFSVFMTIYHLEESRGKVTPFDIAEHLKLSETTIRGYLNSLLRKNLPLERERLFNKKSHFFIKKAFKELNLASKLLKIRNDGSQTTLFTDF